jgi:hypothetical protein
VIGISFRCEHCKAERGEANHWFELRHVKGAPYFLAWSKAAEKPGSKHICSEKCAHSVLDAHLTALREKAKVAV